MRASGRSRTDLLRLTRTALPHGSFTGMEPPVGADPTLPRYKGEVRAGEGGIERPQRLEPCPPAWKAGAQPVELQEQSAGAPPLHHHQRPLVGYRVTPGSNPDPPATSAQQDSNLRSSGPKPDGMTNLPHGQMPRGMASARLNDTTLELTKRHKRAAQIQVLAQQGWRDSNPHWQVLETCRHDRRPSPSGSENATLTGGLDLRGLGLTVLPCRIQH